MLLLDSSFGVDLKSLERKGTRENLGVRGLGVSRRSSIGCSRIAAAFGGMFGGAEDWAGSSWMSFLELDVPGGVGSGQPSAGSAILSSSRKTVW